MAIRLNKNKVENLQSTFLPGVHSQASTLEMVLIHAMLKKEAGTCMYWSLDAEEESIVLSKK